MWMWNCHYGNPGNENFQHVSNVLKQAKAKAIYSNSISLDKSARFTKVNKQHKKLELIET